MPRSKNRGAAEINASSMADIAFLLLIFFLVTTTISQDKGILHRLPPWVEEPQDIPPINQRNVLEILINANDYMLVEGQYLRVDRLRKKAKEFISNNGRDPSMSDSPEKAVISLKNDRGTSYGIYLNVQNELKAAYRELRDNEAARLTGGSMTYTEIDECAKDKKDRDNAKCKKLREQIRDLYPMKISEAEPENYGGN